ncbi:MMPL family transporter [Pokkaliibacter sp. MBI-7]|uniref:efflux RND transporter permease subunit n=1 Tax=Pokkaliibacter sp. MBI-7 TaxID=3040600 RepID=UPI00244A7203|nr:MMPL family transporter [Pokkaliibacter sp. MBI-7]MDH2433886.1 MMPL family transporter [Pokkaliibacter sp. MBI-7]
MKIFNLLLRPVAALESVLERVLFFRRLGVLLLFALATLWLGWQAAHIRTDASFLKMIPSDHPYVINYLKHRESLSGLGNSIRVAVEARDGDIFSKDYQDVLHKISDELFFLPGVDRSGMKSIWTPNVRWTEVTEDGFAGGPVIPANYDGSAASLEQVRQNILRSGQVGVLVANDFKSSIIQVPLLDINPDTGKRLDFQAFSAALEKLVRDKYQNDHVAIHITGFAKAVGDLIDGASQVALFFLVAIGITLVLLFIYSRSLSCTLVPLLTSLVAVVWQLGLLNQLGLGLDPYSMLVPFLVFAIGVSHGVQIVNGLTHESINGADKLTAARRAFRSLFIPGMVALLSDGIGFVTLIVIDIQVIKELAVAASIGVAVIILTNLLLLPVLMSYTGVGEKALQHQRRREQYQDRFWAPFTWFARPRGAIVAVTLGVAATAYGFYAGQDLQIGDLEKGAPELRADSRYNLDNAFINEHYSSSSDVFVVMAETKPEQCSSYANLAMIDRFQGYIDNVAGVQSSVSLANVARMTIAGMNEGSLKWRTLTRNQYMINSSLSFVPPGLMDAECSLVPVIIFLDDHKADTLRGVVDAVKRFAADNNSDTLRFVLAAGNSGIEAATNEVIGTAQYAMLAWVYAVVGLLCLLTFRSLTTVLCILLPLGLTSVLCQALMAKLGIGVKVATLPVIALGVGIGVDYGIYIYSRLSTYLVQGMALPKAYLLTLKSTGKSVAFTGLTLAIGVGIWIWSPIKFQADMGVLLTFMFLWNMLGALIFLPALVCLLKRPVAVEPPVAPQRTEDAEASTVRARHGDEIKQSKTGRVGREVSHVVK